MHAETDMPANPFVVTCEHASNAVPTDDLVLGVPDDLLQTHAAWDPGARELARELARRLDAPVEIGRYTRLLVDLNRSPDNLPEAVPAVCYGVAVPANQGLSDQQRRERLLTYHAPYRAAVAAHVERAMASAGRCLTVSVHSFTPTLDPENRRFDVGVMYHDDRPWEVELADRLIASLAKRGRTSARNRPYEGKADSILSGFRLRWGTPVFTGVEIEINQGIMTGPWVEEIAEALVEALVWSPGDRG